MLQIFSNSHILNIALTSTSVYKVYLRFMFNSHNIDISANIVHIHIVPMQVLILVSLFFRDIVKMPSVVISLPLLLYIFENRIAFIGNKCNRNST